MNLRVRTFVFIFLNILILVKSQIGEIHPYVNLSWARFDIDEEIPPIEIHYIVNGNRDSIILKRRNVLDMTLYQEDPCTFQGHLKSNLDSFVTVSGCPHEEIYEVVLYSSEKFKAKVKDGLTYLVLPKLRSAGDLLIEEDSNLEYLSNAGGAANHDVPKTLYIRLAIGIDFSFKDFFDGDLNKAVKIANQILLHCEGLFRRNELGTTIEFKDIAIYDHSHVSNIGSASQDNLKNMGDYLDSYIEEEFFNHYILLTKDDSGDAVLGMSFIGKICSNNTRSRLSISEYNNSPSETALVVVHELGHNLGLTHDAGVCLGIMYPLIIGIDSWSECSRMQFKGYYNSIKNNQASFCLEEGSGIWSEWSEWSECESCRQIRKRSCKEYICKGEDECIRTCESCKCENELTDGECSALKDLGGCDNVLLTRKVCNKTCHEDKDGGSCTLYQHAGFCVTHREEMISKCAKTCQIYCLE